MEKKFGELSKKDKSVYMDNVGMLYGNGIKQTETGQHKEISGNSYLPSSKNIVDLNEYKTPRNNEEKKSQIAFSRWLKKTRIRHHHSPNGGKMSNIRGQILKSMGVSAGFPDIFIPIPTLEYHGLFVEMKSKAGKLSDMQREWCTFLKAQKYAVYIAYTTDDAIQCVQDYLNLPIHLPPAA